MHFGIVSLRARSRWLSTELQGPKSSLFGPDPSLGIPRGRSGCSKSTQAAHFENARRVATQGTRIFEDMARRIRTDFKNSAAIGTARVDLVRSRIKKLLFRPPLGVSHTRAKSKNPKKSKNRIKARRNAKALQISRSNRTARVDLVRSRLQIAAFSPFLTAPGKNDHFHTSEMPKHATFGFFSIFLRHGHSGNVA